MFMKYPKWQYVKYFKWPLNISTFSKARPYKIYPIGILGLKKNLETLVL
jgi:hypothetical protein